MFNQKFIVECPSLPQNLCKSGRWIIWSLLGKSVEDFSDKNNQSFSFFLGPTADASLLGGWCGGGTPERGTIMSTNPIIFIRFYSDNSIEGTGFKLLYYATKGG